MQEFIKKAIFLKRHKDRFSCEISTTMNLGGDDWPIYLEPSGEVGKKRYQGRFKTWRYVSLFWL
jgi:hypothetical protein